MASEILTLQYICKTFGKTRVLQDINLSLEEGEMFFVLGPSGCGKTTLLRILSGFEEPDKGRIFLKGRDITTVEPHKRNIAMVFQNYALWPHMKVWENVAYGLQVQKLPKNVIEEKVANILSITQLTESGNKFPNQLSGGQQQRVALSRALIVEPKILLLDEPLSNLDAKLREQMRKEIKHIHKQTGVTTIYVTHDQQEALALADRITVLNNGSIEQTGSPFELYFEPQTMFVANFIGDINVLEATVLKKNQEYIEVETIEGRFLAAGTKNDFPDGQPVKIGFRPENILFTNETQNGISGKISDIEQNIELTKVKILTGKRSEIFIRLVSGKARTLKIGQEIRFTVSPDNLLLFRE